jgi:hypothetical protein
MMLRVGRIYAGGGESGVATTDDSQSLAVSMTAAGISPKRRLVTYSVSRLLNSVSTSVVVVSACSYTLAASSSPSDSKLN